MNVLKELISQVKRKEINKKDMFAYKICFRYDDYNQTCYCDGKPCKGKCEAFEEDWNKVDRY